MHTRSGILRSHFQIADRFRLRGWADLSPGATGTQVLRSPRGGTVLKIGDDQGLAAFAQVACSNPRPEFPNILGVATGSNGGIVWTGVWCEHLDALPLLEGARWEAWILEYMREAGSAATDPFGVKATVDLLVLAGKSKGLGVDILHANNVMWRSSTSRLVFVDPFN